MGAIETRELERRIVDFYTRRGKGRRVTVDDMASYLGTNITRARTALNRCTCLQTTTIEGVVHYGAKEEGSHG